MGINMNGIYNAAAANGHIIKTENASGNLQFHDTDSVSSSTLAVATAYNNLYERRKLSWIKMIFIPKYTSFDSGYSSVTGSDGTITTANRLGTVVSPTISTVSDNYGVNAAFQSITPPQLLANTSGVKFMPTTRRWKLFRRGLKQGLNLRFQQTSTTLTEDLESNPAGQWKVADSTALSGSPSMDHFVAVSDVVNRADGVTEAGAPIFNVQFQMKFVWYDKKTVGS